MSKRWASDDEADDLLAGILDETAAEAADEEKRLAEEIEARREAEDRRRTEAKAERMRLAEARLAAERKRQDEIRERRTLKMKALQPEPEAEKSARTEPAPRAPAPESAPVAEQSRPFERSDVQPLPTAAIEAVARRRTLRPLAIAAVVACVLVSIVAVTQPGGYEIDTQQYVKATYAPKDHAVALVEKSYELIPSVKSATPKEVRDERPKIARPKSTRVEEKPTVSDEASERASRLQEMLKDSSDPFGMGP